MGHCLSRLRHKGCSEQYTLASVHACASVHVRARAERESKKESEKDIEAARAKAANFLIGN